jgi:hypothetical protein
MAKYEHTVYICYSPDFDDAYIGRTKDYQRRQSEHWQLQDLLPLMIIIDKVTAATDDAAVRLGHKLETSWRHDFDAAGIPLLNKAGRPRGAPQPEQPIIGELMPLRGVYKPYRLKILGAPLRDALARKGVWVHGFDTPPAAKPRPTKPWQPSYSLPAGVTECRTQAELDTFREEYPVGSALGIRDYWRMQSVGKFKQRPDTGTRVFCVEDATPHSLDALVNVLLTHPAARKG